MCHRPFVLILGDGGGGCSGSGSGSASASASGVGLGRGRCGCPLVGTFPRELERGRLVLLEHGEPAMTTLDGRSTGTQERCHIGPFGLA